MTFVVDPADNNGTGNGDVCIRTDKGTLVALVYATDGTLDRANLIAEALNMDAHRAMTGGALNALKSHQQQLDEDGVMVGVSREALEVVLGDHARLSGALLFYAGGKHYHGDILVDRGEAATNALRAASNELSRLLFNEPSDTTHKALDAVDAVLLAQARAEALRP